MAYTLTDRWKYYYDVGFDGRRFETEDFDDARTYFWSQVFNDPESLWRLIDYAIPKTE